MLVQYVEVIVWRQYEIFGQLSFSKQVCRTEIRTVRSRQRNQNPKIRPRLGVAFMSFHILLRTRSGFSGGNISEIVGFFVHCLNYRNLLPLRRVSISGLCFHHYQVYSCSLRGYTILSCCILKGKQKTHKMI